MVRVLAAGHSQFDFDGYSRFVTHAVERFDVGYGPANAGKAICWSYMDDGKLLRVGGLTVAIIGDMLNRLT
jgi:hypothetical protein